MPTCGSCYREVPGRGTFCPNCGEAARPLCHWCGEAVESDWRYCGGCGTSVEVAKTQWGSCRVCGKDLQPTWLYCPDCGKPTCGRCPSCGRLIKSEWRYCVACGESPGSGAASPGTRRWESQIIDRGSQMDADALNDEGVDLMDQEEYEEAIEKLKQALAIKGDDGMIHYNLAVCYENLGAPKDALREYQAAARLDPGNASTHASMATIFAGRKDFDNAIKELHTVIALAPDSDEADEAKEALLEIEKDRRADG